MINEDNIGKFLPLSESTYYILVSLIEPLHGYGVMQKVEQISGGAVKVGPGTLYGLFSQLEKEGIIEKVAEQDRRKSYRLTPKGREILARQIRRIEIMGQIGQEAQEKLIS